MTGGPPETATAPDPALQPSSREERRRTTAQVVVASVAALLLVGAIVALVYYRTGSPQRRIEAQLKATLDKLVTAQEGFFYDSARYARSLRALPTFRPPPGVHLRVVVDTAHSWPGTATHHGLPTRQCGVWVVRPPAPLPQEARATRGDRAARRELVATTAAFERRYDVPEVLRAGGSVWRDSVLAAAGIPSVTAYELSFSIDDARLALRFFLLALIGIALYRSW